MLKSFSEPESVAKFYFLAVTQINVQKDAKNQNKTALLQIFTILMWGQNCAMPAIYRYHNHGVIAINTFSLHRKKADMLLLLNIFLYV